MLIKKRYPTTVLSPPSQQAIISYPRVILPPSLRQWATGWHGASLTPLLWCCTSDHRQAPNGRTRWAGKNISRPQYWHLERQMEISKERLASFKLITEQNMVLQQAGNGAAVWFLVRTLLCLCVTVSKAAYERTVTMKLMRTLGRTFSHQGNNLFPTVTMATFIQKVVKAPSEGWRPVGEDSSPEATVQNSNMLGLLLLLFAVIGWMKETEPAFRGHNLHSLFTQKNKGMIQMCQQMLDNCFCS